MDRTERVSIVLWVIAVAITLFVVWRIALPVLFAQRGLSILT